MTDEQILEKIERFLNAPADDAIIKNFLVDVVKRNDTQNDSGMLMLLMITCLGYCQDGREIQGIDMSKIKLSDMADQPNIKKIKRIMTEHRIGKDFAACSSFIVNAFGNKMMNIPFSKWDVLAQQCAIMVYKIGAEFEEQDYVSNKNTEQEDAFDDGLANDLLKILGDL